MTMERWSQFIEQWSQDDGAQSRDEFAELVANNLTCWREADMEEVRRAQKHVAQEERARRSWTQRPLQRK